MTQAEVLAAVEAAIGYHFSEPRLLRAALTHASLANHRLQSNERLEFLGDAILAMVICEELYRRFPRYFEGDLTKIKSALVSRRTCAEISRRLGLDKHLFVGKGMSGQARVPNSLAAAVFEALIAAMYLDSGDLERVRQFILSQFEPYIEQAAQSEHLHNFKSQLQQYAQKHLNATPTYEVLDEKGPDHSKCFEVCVQINGRRFPSAWGPSKKEAEQKAAYLTLRELNVIDEDLEMD